jgi:hypothetical protein
MGENLETSQSESFLIPTHDNVETTFRKALMGLKTASADRTLSSLPAFN